MRQDPVLAVRVIKPSYSRVSLTLRVVGGLNYLRGNSNPYFSLTKEEHRKGFPHQCQSFGCDHETILRYWPQFADLAALHLSDIDGMPMHAEANGWYNLAGALPNNAEEQYHTGNSKRHYRKPEGAPRRGDWDNCDYREGTAEECLQHFADSVRTDMETARRLRDEMVRVFQECWTHELERPESERRTQKQCWGIARQQFAAWIEEQKPRWKAEAEACIAKHGLRIYGDPWPANQEVA